MLHLAKNGMVLVGRVNDDGPLKPPPPEEKKEENQTKKANVGNRKTAVSTQNNSGANSAD
jgi:hypothetical protein